jgi:hypothetical protein
MSARQSASEQRRQRNEEEGCIQFVSADPRGNVPGTVAWKSIRDRDAASRNAHGPGIQQLFRDCWEWTASLYSRCRGYKPLARRLGRVQRQVYVQSDDSRGLSRVMPAQAITTSFNRQRAGNSRMRLTSQGSQL